ncbi:MAG: hypothetical protein KDA75_09760, partial [Planctomycetaceae bacterium]|nr:hypothetical protein [Planctomycetaceae bacterium]
MLRLILLLLVTAGTVLSCALTPLQADDALAQQVATFDRSIAEMKTAEAAAQAALVEVQTRLQTQEQTKLRFERQVQNAQQPLDELNKQKPDKEAAAAKAQLARTAAETKLAEAEKQQASI